MPLKIAKINPENPNDKLLFEASDILRDGGLVIVPTETVYGIAANSANKSTLTKLEQIKERPQNKKFSLHIDNKAKLQAVVSEIPIAAYKLIDKYWPGPLTLIFKAKDGSSIGVRLPDDAVCRRVIELADVPVVCPSANISGKPAPKNFQDAIADLKEKVDFAIDTGNTKLGVESTVVDVTSKTVKVLREGAIKEKDIKEVASKKIILFICTGNSCRSVMAEALLKKKLKELGRNDVEVLSAGIMGNGSPATQDTIQVLAAEGINVSSHKAKSITEDMLNKSDLILVMESIHETRVLQMDPRVRNRLFLLKEFVKGDDNNLDISDPIGRGQFVYEETFKLIKEAVNKLSQII